MFNSPTIDLTEDSVNEESSSTDLSEENKELATFYKWKRVNRNVNFECNHCHKSFTGSWIKAANHFLNLSYCKQRVAFCSNPTKVMRDIARKKLESLIPNTNNTIEAAMKKQKNDKDIDHDGDIILCEMLSTCNLAPSLLERDSFKRFVKYLQTEGINYGLPEKHKLGIMVSTS